MKLFLLFLFASLLTGFIFREGGANRNGWLAAGIALATMTLYFLFTDGFI